MKKKIFIALMTCLMIGVAACGKTKETETVEAVDFIESVSDSVVETVDIKSLKEVSDAIEEDQSVIIEPAEGVTSEDAWKFLDEYNYADEELLGESGQVGNYNYTGRFAYPDINIPEVVHDGFEYKSDNSYAVSFKYADNSASLFCTVYLGHLQYQSASTFVSEEDRLEGVDYFSSQRTAVTEEGEVIVYEKISDEWCVYAYKLGAFTVMLQVTADDIPISDEQLQQYVSGITLVK